MQKACVKVCEDLEMSHMESGLMVSWLGLVLCQLLVYYPPHSPSPNALYILVSLSAKSG